MQERELQVLLIEDDVGDAIIVERTLARCRQRFTLRICPTLADALSYLADGDCDVALLDLSLPDSFGLSAFDKIRASAADIPIVVLTGLSDDDLALRALEKGAQDFIVKGNATADLLERTLRYAVQRQQIQTENRLLLTKMQELAQQDPLTGVLNRHSFAENLEREWNRAKRHHRPLTCVVLDIDFFKRINDSFGHAAGDHAIKLVADTLCQTSRDSDFVGRLGGEEFCMLLPETNEDDALIWAERLRRAVAELIIDVPNDTVQVTVSLGVASRRPDSPTAQALVDRADEAMFVAKQLGRDQVVGYSRLLELDRRDQSQLWDGISVRDIMSPVKVYATPCQPIPQAIEKLRSLKTDTLAVYNTDGRHVGVICVDDIMSSSLTSPLSKYCVGDLMQPQLVTYPSEAMAHEVCRFLCRAAVRQVFIVDGDETVGVIQRTDFARWLSESTSLAETTNSVGAGDQDVSNVVSMS